MGPVLDFQGWCRIPSADANDTGRIREGGQALEKVDLAPARS